MIDALLFATRDSIRNAGLGYDEATCDIVANDGRPPPRCGNVFLGVHALGDTAEGDGRLDERYDWGLTLTMRIVVPLDRLGDRLLTSSLARQRGPLGQPSFNARTDALRALYHMDWAGLGDANTLLANWTPDVVVYGFCEPARYKGGGKDVRLAGPEWFGAAPDVVGPPQALVATLRFEGARRMQPLTTFV